MQKAVSMARSDGVAVLQAPPTPASPRTEPFWTRSRREEWVFGMGAMAAITILFAALINEFWVPSGDGDLYVSIARSLALGEGFKFNGQFVNICPPGWPLVLAGVMKIAPTFLAFKIVTIACMVVALGFWFRILLRMMSPRAAAGIVVLTALLNHVYSLTFWTHSEAFFCLCATSGMLFALQIAENRGGLWWRVPLVVTLCVACVAIRWAGILQCLLVVGLLMHHRRWWHVESVRSWAIAAVVVVGMVGTFLLLRHTLALSPEQEVAQREAGAVFDEPTAAPAVQKTVESQKVDLVNVPAGKDTTILRELKRRGVNAGNWMSWLFWQPFRFAASVPALAWTGVAVGWLLIMALAATVVESLRKREWVWLALAGYCAALCMNWPNANARYLVPVAPLLLVGVFRGIKLLMLTGGGGRREQVAAAVFAAAAVFVTVYDIAQRDSSLLPIALWAVAIAWTFRLWARGGSVDRPRAMARLAGAVFAGSVVLVNGALYAVDLRIARSSDFYGSYEAGFNRDLVRACYALNKSGIEDAELAVAERYVNLGKARKSKYAVRAAVLLTGRAVQTVRDKMAGEPRAELLRWCQRRKVKFYLDQRPSVPWRVWHFVLPRWLNEKFSREPLGADSGGWVLYRITIEQVPATQPGASPTTQPDAAPAVASDVDLSPTTEPVAQPGWTFRRSASKVDLPEVKNWPKRVPGM